MNIKKPFREEQSLLTSRNGEFLAAFTFKRRAIDRWEGAIFLAIYVAYIGYLIR